MPISNSYSFLAGPLMAVLALGVIVLLCRWVFSTSTRDQRRALQSDRSRTRADFGLLVPVAAVRSRDDADMLRGLLLDAGIRCTVSAADAPPGAPPSAWTVLVFREDALRASELVSS